MIRDKEKRKKEKETRRLQRKLARVLGKGAKEKSV
jgi:hypothetical protein